MSECILALLRPPTTRQRVTNDANTDTDTTLQHLLDNTHRVAKTVIDADQGKYHLSLASL